MKKYQLGKSQIFGSVFVAKENKRHWEITSIRSMLATLGAGHHYPSQMFDELETGRGTENLMHFTSFFFQRVT